MKIIIAAFALVIAQCCTVFAAEPATTPLRIVSLAPSMTELLFSLGLGDSVVGVTTYCDQPEAAKTKPKIGGMSNPSLEAVVAMKPDLVVMTTDGNPQEFESLLRSLHIKTFVFTARRLGELPQGIRQLGDALGVQDRADRLAQEIQDNIAAVRRKHAGARARRATPARNVLYIVWPEPLIVAGPGTIIDDAISLLGDVNIARMAASTYPKYSLEEVIRRAPDVIMIGKGSGMDMVTVSRSMLKRMESVPAVKTDSICYLGDGLYRLGPRVVQGIEELAECLK